MTNLYFLANRLYISLSHGRQISLDIDKIEWLEWLVKATPEQRAGWSLEPRGFAIYWEELDDGIEIRHLLDMQPPKGRREPKETAPPDHGGRAV